MKIAVINGPNLNMLGIREPEIYGSLMLEDINVKIADLCEKYGYNPQFFQSNIEGEIINYIHSLNKKINYAIINPGAYTHTSAAIFDAIKSVDFPFIEVHLSNLHNRKESFRQTMITSGACIGQICGFGFQSYLAAIEIIRMRSSNND